MPLLQVESLLGPASTREDQQVFPGEVSVVFRAGEAHTIRSRSLWNESGEILATGQSRSRVRELLGEPTDPGRFSGQQPPHYEGYDGPGFRLMVNFQGDVILGFVLSARP